MRTELQRLYGHRLRFTAHVARFGSKKGYKGDSEATILLSDIRIEGHKKILADHAWMNCGVILSRVAVGDYIAFDARIDSYVKGYKSEDKRVDFQLTRPTKLEIEGRAVAKQLPAAKCQEWNSGSLHVHNPASCYHGSQLKKYDGKFGELLNGQLLRLKPEQVSTGPVQECPSN